MICELRSSVVVKSTEKNAVDKHNKLGVLSPLFFEIAQKVCIYILSQSNKSYTPVLEKASNV